MHIINKCLNGEQFRKYVDKKFFGYLPANKLVLHHTHRPTPETWRGKETMLNLKRFYESKGWRTGPHLFVAPDGIWLFTDMRKDGTHAGPGNWRSVGIEMVGDYDKNIPRREIWDLTKFAITALNNKLGLSPRNIKFHRDFMNRVCPGRAVKKGWVIAELLQYSVFANGSFIKADNGSAVYYYWERVLYPVPDMETLKFYWGVFMNGIKVVPSNSIQGIKRGKVLPSIKDL